MSNEGNLHRVQSLFGYLWGRLLAGILIAIPLVATFWVLNIAYTFITKVLSPIWELFGIELPPIVAFAVTLLLFIALGYMGTHVLGRRFIEAGEKLIQRVPLIAPVYSAVKQALDSVKQMKGNTQFKRVVYVEYPSDGCFLIGFVTGQYTEPAMQKEFTMVFLPTSPNPLTGFIVGIPCERVVESGLTLEQATKLIVSAGLVVPPPGSIVPPEAAV